MDVDRLFVKLSEQTVVRLRARCWLSGEDKEIREYVEGLLPEMAKGGSTKLLDYGDSW